MAQKWIVTYAKITPESAEDGDYSESGIYGEFNSLRDALHHNGRYGFHPTKANCYPINPHYVSWVTDSEFRHDYTTDETEERSLHFPKHITASSKRRILRMMGFKTSW